MALSPRRLPVVFACALSLAAPTAAVAQAPRLDAEAAGPGHVPGEAIVRFERGAGASERRAARAAAGVEFERSLELDRAQVVDVDGSLAAAVRRLESQPGVAYAQPNYRYEAVAHDPDTLLGSLWGLEDPAVPNPGVNAFAAWGTTRGPGQVIAVVDSGVDLTHPDLMPNLWTNSGETPGNGIDDDANGVVDDVRGADFVQRGPGPAFVPTGDPDDFNFHGTHVAGTAAAQDDNGLGIAGVAPDAQIMAVRALDGDGGGSSSDIGEAIEYAAREGADVINLSLGRPGASTDDFMSDAVDVAAQHDAVVVAAAGNNGTNNDITPFWPCNLTQANLICVAAVNQDGFRPSFSNFGAISVDIAAPGTSIVSAKTDWGAPVLEEGFNDAALAGWDSFVDGTGPDWGRSTTVFREAPGSATDSPAGAYSSSTYTELTKSEPVSLSGRRGCRMHFDLDQDVHASDAFFAGAVTDAPGVSDVMEFPEDPLPGFFEAEVSISDLDGRTDVYPGFAIDANADANTGDGVYIDRLRVICRDASYVDAETRIETYDQPASGNYVAFQGTSMAAPHVAGIAALVRAADSGATAAQIVDAIKQGGAPLPSFGAPTASGRTADAVGAINAALATPNSQPAPTPTGTNTTTTTTTTAPTSPSRARFGRVSFRRGVVSIRLRGDAATTGLATLSAYIRPVRRVVRVARRSFRIGSTGAVTVKLRLTRPALRQLRRTRRLPLRARVALTNSAGLRSTARARFRITLRRG